MRAKPQRLWLPALPQGEALRKRAAGGVPLSWEVGDSDQRGTVNAKSDDVEEKATAKIETGDEGPRRDARHWRSHGDNIAVCETDELPRTKGLGPGQRGGVFGAWWPGFQPDGVPGAFPAPKRGSEPRRAQDSNLGEGAFPTRSG